MAFAVRAVISLASPQNIVQGRALRTEQNQAAKGSMSRLEKRPQVPILGV